MKVGVRLFAELREKAGVNYLELDVKEGCSVKEVIDRLSSLLPEVFKDVLCEEGRGLRHGYRVFINARQASLSDEVLPDSEVAVLPPVGGGL